MTIIIIIKLDGDKCRSAQRCPAAGVTHPLVLEVLRLAHACSAQDERQGTYSGKDDQ